MRLAVGVYVIKIVHKYQVYVQWMVRFYTMDVFFSRFVLKTTKVEQNLLLTSMEMKEKNP